MRVNPPNNNHLRCNTCGRFHKQDYLCKGVIAWNRGLRGFKNPHTDEWNKKISLATLGQKRPSASGENNHNWIADRTKIKTGDRFLNDPLQKQWRREVKDRDNWKCMISDENCSGRLEAHHILPWSQFPELRYETKNGITLCHHHHPRKGVEVIELAPSFQRMVRNYLA